MKIRTRSIIFLAIIALLLAACQVNFITDIKNDGSGTYVQEIGFDADEAEMAGMSAGDSTFCSQQATDLPPNTSVRQETRNEDQTWCIYETTFASLDDLKAIYQEAEIRINEMSIKDDTITYDISVDLSNDSQMVMGAEFNWFVTLPGRITEHNATEKDGNTLKWTLSAGQVNQLRAVSEPGGASLGGGGGTLLYILGGMAFLCLCCVLPLAIGALIFFLIRRNKKLAGSVQNPV